MRRRAVLREEGVGEGEREEVRKKTKRDKEGRRVTLTEEGVIEGDREGGREEETKRERIRMV